MNYNKIKEGLDTDLGKRVIKELKETTHVTYGGHNLDDGDSIHVIEIGELNFKEPRGNEDRSIDNQIYMYLIKLVDIKIKQLDKELLSVID